MNYIKQVAEMLGVELEEEFKITNMGNHIFRFMPNRLEVFIESNLIESDWEYSMKYVELIEGTDKIIKLPKFPKAGTEYWCVLPNGMLLKFVFSYGRIMDIMNFKTGNYFLTKEEITEEDIERIVAMLNSAERLV